MARKSIEWINKVYDKILSLGVSKVVCNKRLVAFKYPNEKSDGENDWINKWRCLGKPNTQWYRLYSHFIGNNIDIVPDDIIIKATIDNQEMRVINTNMVKEFAGGRELTAYLIQVETRESNIPWHKFDLQITDADNHYGAATIYNNDI